jgi:hypothetical protein
VIAIRTYASALTLTVVLAASAAAQIGGKPIVGGNPTPGTPQPDPPNLADRITLTGCVEVAKTSPVVDGNTVTDSKFQLTGAELVSRVPPDTGGSALASSPASRTYRLTVIESQLSPFVGVKVEISGEVLPRPGGSPPAASPTLQVEFVQKLSASCRTSG